MVLLPYFDKVFLLQKLTGKKTAQKTEYHTLKQVVFLKHLCHLFWTYIIGCTSVYYGQYTLSTGTIWDASIYQVWRV